MKKGFTLVELSIVLVIVGLLIGGILAGQSLISSAKINREVSKVSQWSIAITMFKDKFKQYPGDSNLFNTATAPAGNNDGDIADNLGACPASMVYEYFSAWSHLTQSKMLTGKQYVWDSATACTDGVSGMVPTPDFKDYNGSELNSSMIWRSVPDLSNYDYAITNHYRPYDFWAIEKKLDDGVPSQSTGRIMNQTYGSGHYNCDASGVAAEIVDVGNNGININEEGVICYVEFQFRQTNPFIPN